MALVLAGLFCLSGCKQVVHTIAQSTPNTPAVRQRAVDGARTSCTEAALRKLGPGATPGVKSRVATYCNCFATQGLAKFSNAELAEIGLRGKNSITPQQQSKLDDAVNLCKAELNGQ